MQAANNRQRLDHDGESSLSNATAVAPSYVSNLEVPKSGTNIASSHAFILFILLRFNNLLGCVLSVIIHNYVIFFATRYMIYKLLDHICIVISWLFGYQTGNRQIIVIIFRSLLIDLCMAIRYLIFCKF